MSAPLIAVTGPVRGGRSGWAFTWLSLRASGARARRLHPPFRSEQLEGVSGVVIGGGANVDPQRYAELPAIEYDYDRARDEFEWRVLQDATSRELPLLGICRGAQLVNVFAGGSLYQNLEQDVPGVNLRHTVLARKRVLIAHDSVLEHVMGVREVKVNSLHRQGIRKVGGGLRVCARDSDGIVQAIEAQPPSRRFLLGVQWHPEYLINYAAQRRLFSALTVAAQARAIGEPRAVEV